MDSFARPPAVRCRGGARPSRRNAADPHGLPIKTCRPIGAHRFHGGRFESFVQRRARHAAHPQRAIDATAPAEPRNDKSGSLPHPEGRNDKAGSAPLPCHCEEGASPTWQSQAGTYESAGAFLRSSQSCEIATAPAEPRNDKSGSLPLNVQKAPRVRRSDCRKSLAEFAPAGAKKMEIIFSGGVYVGENTARLANVRRACPSCAAASRSPFQTRAQ